MFASGGAGGEGDNESLANQRPVYRISTYCGALLVSAIFTLRVKCMYAKIS